MSFAFDLYGESYKRAGTRKSHAEFMLPVKHRYCLMHALSLGSSAIFPMARTPSVFASTSAYAPRNAKKHRGFSSHYRPSTAQVSNPYAHRRLMPHTKASLHTTTAATRWQRDRGQRGGQPKGPRGVAQNALKRHPSPTPRQPPTRQTVHDTPTSHFPEGSRLRPILVMDPEEAPPGSPSAIFSGESPASCLSFIVSLATIHLPGLTPSALNSALAASTCGR
jgi:hypothetical protein